MGIYTIISLITGFIVILFLGWIMYVHYTNDDLEHWVPPTLIVGVLVMMLFVSIGHGADKNEKLHREIKYTITSNYNDVANYHDDSQQSFVSDGIRYTFDYDKDQKMLTVFTNTSVVDATFVNGVKWKTGK